MTIPPTLWWHQPLEIGGLLAIGRIKSRHSGSRSSGRLFLGVSLLIIASTQRAVGVQGKVMRGRIVRGHAAQTAGQAQEARGFQDHREIFHAVLRGSRRLLLVLDQGEDGTPGWALRMAGTRQEAQLDSRPTRPDALELLIRLSAAIDEDPWRSGRQ